MPFFLDGNPTTSEISEAVNYLLNNFNTTYTAESNSGQITGPTGQIVGYLYKYIAIKYADSFDGSVNFSNSPTNRLYYGIRNSNSSVESTNPTDYTWQKVTGGFNVFKFLFYQTSGGRQIDLVVATTNPTENYVQEDGTAIDLDLLTSGKGRQIAYPSIYIWTSTNVAPTRPSTTTTFTWSTGLYSAPSGWSTTPPTPGSTDSYLWAITVPLSASVNATTSVCDWTNTSYPIYKVTANGANGLNFLTGYLVQSQSSAAPSFTTPTTGATLPSGWYPSAPSVSVGQVIWYIQGQYNSSNVTINGVAPNTTAWTGPVAASVFQDIRSDNWNGSNPPVGSNPSTWGTAGYYIERTSGSTYLNNIYARGTLQSGTTPAVSGTTMTGSGGVINSTGTFALGNSSTNISFNGTQMTLNGNVVATGNINSNGVTNNASSAGYNGSSIVKNNITSSSFLGFWNAATNSPFLQSGVGTANTYYVVSTAGNTTLDGVSPWALREYVFFDGLAWSRGYQILVDLPVFFAEAPQNVLVQANLNLLNVGGLGNTNSYIYVAETTQGIDSFSNGITHASSTVLPFSYSFTGVLQGNRNFRLYTNQILTGASYVAGVVSFSVLGVKR
jgi:hypothetical protein